MRSLLGRFHRPMSRGLVNNMLTMNNLGDGSTLSLDFTTMGGVLDPRLTFTRSTTATFVNSSGYVEYAAHNLYYNTNFATISTVGSNPSLTGTGWSYALNSGTSFSATFNTNGSVTMSASAGRIGLFRSAGFAGTGRRLIFSVDITSVGDTGLPPSQLVNEGTKTNDAYYINGTLWTSGNVVGPCTLSFVFTSNPAGNAATYFGLGMSSNSTGVVTFANPRWGFYGGVNQLTYSPNTAATNANYLTAEYHAPRFDYSPTNIGEPRGLLVEGQTQNVLYYSQDVTQATRWTIQGGIPTSYTSISATGGTAPDNTNTANLCTEGITLIARSIYQGLSAVAGTYTASVWVKAGTGSTRYIRLVISSASSNFVYVTVNTSNGAITQAAANIGTATGATATVVPYPGSWYRIQLTGTLVAAVNFVFIVPLDSPAPTITTTDYGRDSYLGNGSTFLIWGAQVEAGSGASSYIPTGASQVTRAVDTAIIAAGTNFNSWYTGGTSGTFVSNWYGSASSSTARSVIATSDVDDKHLHMYQTASALTLRLADFGALATVTTANNLTANALTKGAFSYAGTATSLCLNGGTVATNTLGFSVAPTFLSIGGPSTTGTTITDTSVMLNNSIRTIKYYPTRLTDAQIKDITT